MIGRWHKEAIVYDPKGLLLAVCLLVPFAGCQLTDRFKDEPEKDVVARVHDEFLYRDELSTIITPGLPAKDSVQLAKSYIESWIRNRLVLDKAEANLAEELKNVDRKLEQYRNSLIRYSYEREIIRQNLDTTVTKSEIDKYYNDNKANFQLRDNIVKALYVKVKKNAPKVNQVRVWYKSNTAKERKLLEEYCNKFATDFMPDDTTWHSFDELLKKVPVRFFDKESYLRNNSTIEAEDSTDLYFVKIKDYKIRESQSPLSFVEEDIRAMIVNKKKLDVIRDMEKSIYDEALKKNEFEIFGN
ncbi:MAG: peptidyl-prolyl cis-trans isomerase [Bacteroidota bacterium]